MGNFSSHLRNAFLAGILAVGPVAVTAFAVWYIESSSREAVEAVIGRPVPPFVGVLLAVALIYVVGVVVSSLVGKLLLRLTDRVLSRLPLVKTAYAAWKQIALTPGGGEGMYARVVLVGGVDSGVPDALQLGFTSGEPVAGRDDLLPVFLPQCPNPLNGRLLLVPRAQCQMTNLTTEEAFKMLLSSGNYVPAGVAPAAAANYTRVAAGA